MTVFAHVAVGAAVATLAPDPITALAVGAGSHIPADLIAHNDLRTGWEFVLAALLFGVVAVTSRFDTAVMAGAIGAALPDAEHLLAKLKLWPFRRAFWPTHSGVIGHGSVQRGANIIFQLSVTAVMLSWVAGAPALLG